jgi:hypothetical protein
VHLSGWLQLQARRGARDRRRQSGAGRESTNGARVDTVGQRRAWEQPLRALVEAPHAHATGRPLAIELALRLTGVAGQGAPRLIARLMRPGARGGWVNGSLAWSALEPWRVRGGEYRQDHLALVRELYAVHRAREGRPYYYGYGADKTLDLTDCDSAQLWSLLDEADRIGVALLHARQGLGEVGRHRRGELVLDVTGAGADGSVVTPVLRVDGHGAGDFEPVLFLGTSGHGIVCAERADAAAGHGLEDRRLQLVRLGGPTPPQLQRMVLEGAQVEIPAGDLHRFSEELCPALRGVAPVMSSDGSFTPPEISTPALVLRASYGPDHLVQLGWEWSYRVGSTTRRTPLGLDGGGPGFRDLEAERATLAGTALEGTALEHLGLLDGAGRPADAPPVLLTGIESMRLTTELLPQLSSIPMSPSRSTASPGTTATSAMR